MKNKKKKILTMVVVVYSLLGTLGGCRFERNVDISIPTELEKTQSEMNQNDEDMSQVQNESARTSAETLSVVYKNIDLNLFAQVFMETSTIEEAEKYKPKHSLGEYYYEIGGKTIVYTGITSGIISYDDATDGAGDCYDAIINSLGYLTNGMGNSFRQLCPDENLDTCTKEQAIEACSKYAQACGYGSDSISAPGEGFDIVTKGQVEELRDEGKDEEAEKMDNQLHSATGRGLPWKKEHEAMVLYYRSEINGLLMDSHESGLEIVYVPYMDKIVLIKGNVPCQQTAVSKISELISKEAAVSQVAQTLGIRTQDDIQIDAV